jgi:hypothetical protein
VVKNVVETCLKSVPAQSAGAAIACVAGSKFVIVISNMSDHV